MASDPAPTTESSVSSDGGYTASEAAEDEMLRAARLPWYRRFHLRPRFMGKDPDRVSYDALRVEEAYRVREDLDWRQRVNLMWRYDEHGSPSPELTIVTGGTTLSCMSGFLLGGYIDSKDVYYRFMRDNKHEMLGPRTRRKGRCKIGSSSRSPREEARWHGGWACSLPSTSASARPSPSSGMR